ncbi:AraC family transcriptional regulator [Paenibacillus sp. HWE-109]|uniref:AraC family transcriptional regulator n=1 Tax=Paenibacillus sp. HWE-109 TaxID=1306526 RepID=UPI001EDE130D|nr:AraC family transcriptional regulator [Paenibacillus sp. HWE-109]UKS28221.1 AraC family transcriptional regulator [Paenibacillus sp. HWE-109]
MDNAQQQLIRLYLDNLQVHVTEMGHNQVWSDWRDLDYTPDYNKFYLICDGEGWLKIGDTEYAPKPGQWFLMPQGVKQSYSYTDGPRFTKYWCHFTAKVGENNLFELLKIPVFLEREDGDEPQRLFQELLSYESYRSLTAPLLMKAAVIKLIAYYIEQAASDVAGVQPAAMSEPLQAVIEHIHLNYYRNLTIDELAERAHLHPNYFIRVFKRRFGTSPIQYVNRKRIEEVKWLLTSTNLMLAEIGTKVGIPDISYLSKLFKSSTGLSPTAYRLTHHPNMSNSTI